MKDYEISTPGAESLIESLRAVGYSLPTAIADIIDNSVAAGAANIWLNFFWDGRQSHISILDDGDGMTEEVLSNAMRPGSQSPLDIRDPADLGRFGLGLKTASFSQARDLSVISKSKNNVKSRRHWDLDVVVEHNEWRLLKNATAKSEKEGEKLDSLGHGTLVMWENMDRIVGNVDASNQTAQQQFLDRVEEVKKHVSMIFHRFIDTPRPRLKIWINGTKEKHLVKAWDPFMSCHKCTTLTPVDPVAFGGTVVRIRGYILPHKDKLDDEEYNDGAGPLGWNAQQGFYIYRNDRMLVSGSWLKLGPVRAWAKEEHYKLARLSIDIPNSMDSEWSLDVKKSKATPPSSIRYKLTKLAEDVRDSARSVFVHRGEYGPRGNQQRQDLERPWKSSVRNGQTIYKIRRNHVLIREVLQRMGSLRPEVESVLRFLEETVPVQKIWLDVAEQENDHAVAYAGLATEVVLGDMKRVFEMLIDSGIHPDEAAMQIGAMEPFNRYPEIISQLTTG